ncbi:MAG: histidinol dehydrogenase [Gemmatimonadaceae bacterium]
MTHPLFRVTGPVDGLSASDEAVLFNRGTSSNDVVRSRTAEIIARVRARGDAALVEMAQDLDGVSLETIEVDRADSRAALRALEPGLRRALERAAANIATAHRAWLPTATEVETEPGIIVGRRPDPLGRVGVYAPGGRAAYPSSVLMGAIPARVAGVREIVLCSPPHRAASGLLSPVVLAAAELAGVDRIFAIGGAGAIAAMAYGTAAVPRVDRIVGPGNAYVAEAKAQIAGVVAIDAPAGPSELLVIADGSATADGIAREMLAQAEHDPLASVVLLADGEATARRIAASVSRLLPGCPRADIIEQSFAARGALLWQTLPGNEQAVDLAERYAPEHLLLAITAPERLLPALRNAGTIFLGTASSVAFGDYITGANHVLPTGGAARSYSGLSTLDFFRWTTYQRVEPAAAIRLADDVRRLAEAEGLYAHAAAGGSWATGASS